MTLPSPHRNGNGRNDVYIVRGFNDPRLQRLVRIHSTSGEVDTGTVALSPYSGKV